MKKLLSQELNTNLNMLKWDGHCGGSKSWLQCVQVTLRKHYQEFFMCDMRNAAAAIRTADQYRIVDTWKCPRRKTCGYTLSWDRLYPYSFASVRPDRPANWQFVPVKPGSNVYKIKR